LGPFGFRNHVVAVVDGAVVGLGTAFSGRDLPRYTLSIIRQIMTFYGPVSGMRVIRRAVQIGRVIAVPAPEHHCIAHLGVAPAFRGKGIGTGLIRHLLDDGRRKGRPLAVLDVSVENPRARALYERLGFRVTCERVSTLRDGAIVVPNHFRMERPIDSADATD
jgi:ribosomal protein S18 acetylase RimI-like enzyme